MSLPGQFEGLPFAAGTLRGVRSFIPGTDGSLFGPIMETAWKPGENQAICLAGRGARRNTAPVPREDPARDHDMSVCQHGFYAYLDGSNDYRAPHTVEAVIEGWGECLIGTRGFRAMKARILALSIEPRRWLHGCECGTCIRLGTWRHEVTVATMSDAWQVPVFDRFDDMLAAFPTSPPEPAPATGWRLTIAPSAAAQALMQSAYATQRAIQAIVQHDLQAIADALLVSLAEPNVDDAESDGQQ